MCDAAVASESMLLSKSWLMITLTKHHLMIGPPDPDGCWPSDVAVAVAASAADDASAAGGVAGAAGC
eukprot:298625-Amphidinium_carterae.1